MSNILYKFFEKLLGLEENFIYKIYSIKENNEQIEIVLVHNFRLTLYKIFIGKNTSGLIEFIYHGDDDNLINLTNKYNSKIKLNYNSIIKTFKNINYHQDGINFSAYPYTGSEISFLFENRYKKGINDSYFKELISFNFIDGFYLKRNIDKSISIIGNKINITHAEAECVMCDANIYNGKSDNNYRIKDFFDYGLNYKFNSVKKNNFKNTKNIDKEYSTYINEYESVVGGSEKKIEEIIKKIPEINKYNFVNVHFNCLPGIIGDDVKSLIDNIKDNIDIPIIYLDQNRSSDFRTIKEIFNNIRISENKLVDTNICSLFGFPDSQSLEEFKKIFNQLGIIIKNFFPVTNLSEISFINNSRKLVFIDSGRENRLNEYIRSLSGDFVFSYLPYGYMNSKIFVDNIMKDFPVSIENNGKYINYLIKLEKKLNNIKKITKNINLGFVLLPSNIFEFLNYFRGINMIDFIKESGFGIRIFIYTNSNSTFCNDIEKKFLDLFGEKYNIKLIFSDKKEDLNDFLSNDEINIYYSEIFNDSRILKYSKMQFSLDFFEPGFEGYIRTLESLIKLSGIVDNLKKLK